jgi:hypothetical protein
VTILVPENHALLQLKRALDWERLGQVMVKHWRAAGKNVAGGPGMPWPVSLYVPLLVLMAVKALNSRQMEEYLAENGVARVFMELQDQERAAVRDHSNIARAQAALGEAGWQAVNELLVTEAVRCGFGKPEVLSSDTTVQEPQIGYPHEAGILRGIAQRVVRSLRKLQPRGGQAVAAAKEKAKEVLKGVKHYHLFAKTKAEKDAVLQQLVHQTQALSAASQQVIKGVKETTSQAVKSAIAKLTQMATVTQVLLPQIAQWLATGVVASGKLLHAGITTARAIVKNKVGKKVEFGLKWLLNRIEGGYVFGTVVGAHADEKQMPLVALSQYRAVFGPEGHAADAGLRPGRERGQDGAETAPSGGQEGGDRAGGASRVVHCHGRPEEGQEPAGQDRGEYRGLKELEVRLPPWTPAQPSNPSGHGPVGPGVSEREQTDAGPRRERPKSASSCSLTPAQGRGNERSRAKGEAKRAKEDNEEAEDERTRIHPL